MRIGLRGCEVVLAHSCHCAINRALQRRLRTANQTA